MAWKRSKEKNAECQRQFRANNPTANSLSCKKYYEANKDKISAQKKIYFQSFKESGYSDRLRTYQRVNHRYRLLAKKCENPLTIEEWTQILEEADYKCMKCKNSNDLTMDHIKPIIKGGLHTKNNIQVLCRRCNSSKGSKDETICG